MKIIFTSSLLTLCLALLVNCKEGAEPDPKVTPTNLTIAATVSDDGSGLVTFLAEADDAVLFKFIFGDDAQQPTNSDNGIASHTYLNTGTFTVTVAAYSSDNLFVQTSTSVTVQVNEPAISDEGYSTPESYNNMTLVWQDEFSGDALNLDDWTYEIGNGSGGWGNNELEYYTNANTIMQDGYLTIKAKKETIGGFNYTSSRIVTKDKQEFKYGRIDIRAILPKGQGIWPALWMLGSNISEVGWPKCGEIDIMELIGGAGNNDKTVFGTLHWDDKGTKVCTCDKPGHVLSTGIFNDKFHVFTMTWDESFITWYVDDVQFNKIDITPVDLEEFHKEFFFIFNLAVGGNWPGSPNASTVFPQRMVVDYIRVFQPQ